MEDKKEWQKGFLVKGKVLGARSKGRCFIGVATPVSLKDRSMDKSRPVDLWSEDGEAPVRFSESSMSEHHLSGYRETAFFVRRLENELLHS